MSYGGAAYYLEHFVTHRVVKYTYGTSAAVTFRPYLPDHKARADKVILGPQGPRLNDHFEVILKQVITILLCSLLSLDY